MSLFRLTRKLVWGKLGYQHTYASDFGESHISVPVMFSAATEPTFWLIRKSMGFPRGRVAKLAAGKLLRPIPCRFGNETAAKAANRYQTCTNNALQPFLLQVWQ